MEDLTNSQIVLLSILVSFVTSMAAAIITTSLIDEAPVQVGQTVNRVVERTIERVVPEEGETETEVIRETIVVTEDDQVVKAIAANTPNLVRIPSIEGSRVGVIVNGLIVTDGLRLVEGVTYAAQTQGGDSIEVQVIYGAGQRVAVLQPTTELSGGASIAQANPQLGQTVVSLGGIVSDAVTTGRVLQLISGTTGTTTPQTTSSIATNLPTVTAGSMLLNLSGDVVGIRTDILETGDFVSRDVIVGALSAAQAGE